MPRYILINGPARSGKDTIAEHVWHTKTLVLIERFSFPLKRAFAGIMNLDCDAWGNVQPWEDKKDTIIPTLGKSYRQFQIDLSERLMKPQYGRDVFGRLLLERTREYNNNAIIIVPDCGFQIEVDTLADARCLLIQLERPGFTFEGDSREYVVPPAKSNWTFVRLTNDRDRGEVQRNALSLIEDWDKSSRKDCA